MSDESGHKWKSERQMTDYGTGYEILTICEVCGIEHPGQEFLDRIPTCAEIEYAEQNP